MSITEDPKEDRFTENLMRTLKNTLPPSQRPVRSFRALNDFCEIKKVSGFLVMIYDRVDDKNKFSYKKFGLGKPSFSCHSHSETEAKEIFS